MVSKGLTALGGVQGQSPCRVQGSALALLPSSAPMYQFSLSATQTYLSLLPWAVVTTLWLSLSAILASLVVGVAGALCRTGRSVVLRFVGGAYVEVLRNIPLLIVIYLVYFGLA